MPRFPLRGLWFSLLAVAPFATARAQTLPDWANGNVPATSTTIGAGVTLNITTAASHTFNSTTITNNGTINWQNGPVSSTAGNLVNNSGATFNDSASGNVALSGTAIFTNVGTYHKLSGSSQVGVTFNNQGSLVISSGILTLNGGSTHTGTANLAAGANLILSSGNHTFSSGAVINGAGNLQVSGGNTTLSGITGSANIVQSSGTITVTGSNSLSGTASFTDGTLTGAGTLTVGNLVTLNRNTLTGSGILNANGGVSITGGFTLNGTRTVNLSGNSTWTGGGIYGGGGSILNILPTANFTASAESSFYGTYYGGGANTTVINNQGTFTKPAGSPTGGTSLQAVFNNTGTVNVQTGWLQLSNGGSSPGTINLSSGGNLGVDASFSFPDGAVLNGPGTVRINGGTTSFTGNHTHSAALYLAGGLLSVNGTTSTSGNVTLWTGDYSGAGTFNVSGLTTWNDTTLAGSGTINTLGGLHIAPDGHGNFRSGQTLNVYGSSTWTKGSITAGGGSVLNIKPGATLTNSFDGALNGTYWGGTATIVNNEGTFAKSAGSGSGATSISGVFNNSGNVIVSAGTLALTGGGTHTGSANIASGATLALSGGTHTFNAGATIDGTGNLKVSGGNTTFSGNNTGTAHILISGGNASFSGITSTSGGGTFSGGTLNGTGTVSFGNSITLSGTTLTGNGTLHATAGAVLANNFSFNGTRAITLSGNSTWSAGYIYGGGGSVLNVTPTANFTTSFDGTLNGGYYGSGANTTVVNNQGNFIKSTGAANAATHLDAVFNNSGTVTVQAGTLELGAGGTHTGSANIASGATLTLSGGNHAFNSGATIAGTGNLKVSGGNTTFSGANTGTAHIVVTGGNAAFNGVTSTSGGGTLSGGTLGGTGTLSFGNSVTLSGTTLTGNGTLQATAGAAITNHFSFNGTRTVNLSGNSTWSAGYIYGGGGSILNNLPGATLTTTTNSTLNGSYYGGGPATTVFNNQGTFIKNASTGVTEFTALVHNTGTLNIQTGTIELRGGGSNTGLIDIAAGAVLELASTAFSLDAGTQVAGPGTLRISNGNTTVSANVASAGAAHFAGGTFNGPGNLTFAGLVTLGGTTLSGTGTVAANAGAALTNSFSINGTQSLALAGNSTWTSGVLYTGTGATLNNTGNLTNNFNGSLYHYYGGAKLTFNNSGTFTKSAGGGIGSGTTDLDAVFHNTGTVNVQSGKLELRGGGSSTGTVHLSPGATLAIDGGTFGFGATSQITGAGTLLVSGGNATFSGNNTATAQISVSNGNATFTGNTTTAGGGTFSGGKLNGAGHLTLHGPVTFNGTTFAGTGTVAALGGATLANSFSVKDGPTLTLAGNSTWTGTIYQGNGGTLNNTGNLTNPSNASLYHYYGGAKLTFHNSGTFTKSTATGSTDINAPFHNTGAVNVQAGTLNLASGGSSSGSIDVSAAATLLLSGGGFDVTNAAQLAGAGLLRLTDGTLHLAGALGIGTFTLEGGRVTGSHRFDHTVNWHHGDLNAAAAGSTTTIASGATLVLANGGSKDFNYRTMLNAAGGSVYWHSGYLRSGNGGAFVNHGTFYDQNASGYSVYNPGAGSGFGGTFSFTNHGTYTRDVGSTTSFQVPFHNHGTVNLNLGNLQLDGGGTMSATSIVNAAAGTQLSFTGNYSLADGAQLSGAGAFLQTGGTLTLDGLLRAPVFQWQGGDWNAAVAGATTTIASGTTLALANGGNKDFNRRNITVAPGGTVTWSSGYLRAGNGSVFTNHGTFLDQNASSYSAYNPGSASGFGGSFTFVNHATYTRDAGGRSYFYVPFDNHGTVNLTAGELQLDGGGTMSATSVVNAAAGTHLHFTSDYTINAGARFAGAGSFIHSSGSLHIAGALQATSFDWRGGDWNAPAPALTSIASGTVLNIDSGGNKDFNRRSITIDAGGTVHWKSGYLRGGNGSVFANHGTFHDANASGYTVYGATQSGLGGTFTFVNHGVYLRDVGSTTTFTAPFENHGTVTLAGGSLQLAGGGAMSATSVVNAAAGTNLYFSDNYTLAPGAQFTGAGNFIHNGGTLTIDGVLQASSFRWSGGNWNAPAGGVTTTIGSGSTLHIDNGGNRDFNRRGLTVAPGGTVNWHSGYLRSGNGGSIVNTGTFNDVNASSYSIHNPGAGSGFGGTFSFNNAGHYNKSTGGTTYVDVPFTNSGTLNLAGGAMVFNSTFATTGALHFSNHAAAHFSAPFSTHAPLTGTGTIHGSVTAGGQVAPGTSPGLLAITGSLTLLDTSTLLIELGGATPGSGYDVLQVGGAANLAGALSVSFTNGFNHAALPTQTFAVLTSATLTGAFANIANGATLLTSDGLGTFRVNYGLGSAFATNSVILSNFQAIPEPSTYALLALGAGLVLFTLRRRKRR